MDRKVRFTPRALMASMCSFGVLAAMLAFAIPGAAVASAEEPEAVHGKLTNWTLTGSVTDKTIGQTIALPAGCTFNGEITLPGSLLGNTSCPAFTDTVTVLGLPAKLGFTLSESRAVGATITEPVAESGNFVLSGSAADNIGVTGITLFGLNISTSCTTSTPVVFPLNAAESGAELLKAATFTGTTTIPSITCSGGLLGSAFGSVLTTLMSGANNPFTLSVVHPSSTPATTTTAAHSNYAVPYGYEGLLDFGERFLFGPTEVTGGNNGCKPSTEHPNPVVLVHGTSENEGDNWVTLAPLLANAGYCVYAFNYGEAGILSLGGRIDGINHIANSAAELSTFVNTVLAETGASKVDIVGHSQGGMMPNYYIKNLGGSTKVNDFVALSPSNHGTTVSGLTNALSAIESVPGIGLIASGIEGLVAAEEPAWTEQEETSSFMKALFPGVDPVVAPVNYTVLESTHDEVVTPYTNAFLSAGTSGASVTNVTIQNQCPADPTGHIGMIEDGPATQDVLNALSQSPKPYGTAAGDFQPTCTNYGVAF